jgi:hypothetical protein
MASGADANLAPVGIPGGNIRLRARYGADRSRPGLLCLAVRIAWLRLGVR